MLPQPANGFPLKTILLVSPDGLLASRIGAALSRGECVVRVAPFPSAAGPPGPWQNVIVVIDCRGFVRSETEAAIMRARAAHSAVYRCVALVAGTLRRPMDVITQGASFDYDVVLAEHDHIGSTIRAILNDADESVGAAIALEALRIHVEPVATTIAEAVLSSGCKICSVGGVERALETNRADLGSALAREGSPMPKEVVAIARAAYAIVLLRRTNLTIGKIAERIGYSKSRWLQALLRREFGCDAQELTSRSPDLPIEELLDALLAAWRAGVRAGGGAP